MRKQVEQTPDFIKLYVRLPPALVKAAIDEAHARGVRVMGNLGETTWGEAAEMGIDSLAHSRPWGLARSVVPTANRTEFQDFYVPNRAFRASLFRRWREVVDPKGPEVTRLAELLRRRHVEVHPNLVLGEAALWGDDATVRQQLGPHATGRHPYSGNWSTAEQAEAKRAFPVMLEIIRVFHEKGVLLTTGTDYLNPWMTPGLAYHRELELFAQAPSSSIWTRRAMGWSPVGCRPSSRPRPSRGCWTGARHRPLPELAPATPAWEVRAAIRAARPVPPQRALLPTTPFASRRCWSRSR